VGFPLENRLKLEQLNIVQRVIVILLDNTMCSIIQLDSVFVFKKSCQRTIEKKFNSITINKVKPQQQIIGK